MRISYIFNALGLICKYVGIVIAVPILVALYYNDIYSIKPFLTASVVSIVLGFVLNNKNIKNDYLNDLKTHNEESTIYSSYLNNMDKKYLESSNERIVIDYISGMTDNFAIDTYNKIIGF